MTVIPVLSEDHLAALVQDPAITRQIWAVAAVCRTVASDAFFPEEGQAPVEDVLAYCDRCRVAAECLATALVHEAADGSRHGWWGGLGPDDREVLWIRLGTPATPPPVEIDLRDPVAVARYLRNQRQTVPAIAAELGCSERTVYRYLAAHAA